MRLYCILVVILLAFSIKAKACYQAELYKIYPIGICNDTIVSVDMHILRYNAGFFKEEERITGNIIDEGFRDNERFVNEELEWIIRTYISRYDKSQNLIESIPLDSARFYTENNGSIINKLKILYDRGFDEIILNATGIELFKPIGVQFCDYSDECKNLISDHSSIIKEKDLDYLIEILKNRPASKFPNIQEAQKFLLLGALSSVRKYTSNFLDLFIINLQIGQIYGNESIPQISLGENIKSAVYEEPLFYHGNGSDIFYLRDISTK